MPNTSTDPLLRVASFFVRKYRERARTVGVFVTAVQMRKQGISLQIAVLILATA